MKTFFFAILTKSIRNASNKLKKLFFSVNTVLPRSRKKTREHVLLLRFRIILSVFVYFYLFVDFKCRTANGLLYSTIDISLNL